ncbi:hypothetical protein NQ317_012228 [Molorchus minor]|uniref:DUF4604 domain-containing protein n=1 Tax=Molorchus minor TaxID=1323400 RepID=A0ABQ9IXU6_9CUCU|nr:hypothetical protein NQ317_012228 [Molorchus minor]
MSKRQVAYVKPEEPSFLKELKKQAGYKEGPTVDTKRENYGEISEGDLQDTEEEQPTVVVLKPGDLTAEEAASETERLNKDRGALTRAAMGATRTEFSGHVIILARIETLERLLTPFSRKWFGLLYETAQTFIFDCI